MEVRRVYVACIPCELQSVAIVASFAVRVTRAVVIVPVVVVVPVLYAVYLLSDVVLVLKFATPAPLGELSC